MEDANRLAGALALAAREINAGQDLESTLDSIVHTAVRSLAGIDHVGVSIAHRNGNVETKAGTSQLVWELDALQYASVRAPARMRSTSNP